MFPTRSHATWCSIASVGPSDGLVWSGTGLVSWAELVQVSFVGATEEQARETAQKKGYGNKVAVVKTSFKANTKVCMCPPHLPVYITIVTMYARRHERTKESRR